MTSEDEKNLFSAATDGKWPKVLTMYQKKELRMATENETGDTILHKAVSSGKEYVVESMVNLVCGETNKQDKKSESLVDENGDEEGVLGAQNKKGNTPLHLAASMGNAEMCKKIGQAYPSLIAKRNNVGETPLFVAALDGNRKAFLWLHFLYMESLGDSSTDFTHCIRRNNGDTILHCALEEEYIDVAIEIVLLYKNDLNEMIKRNENKLTPLHLLAANPSAFESNRIPDLPYVAQLIYHWIFRVKKKKQATTRKELEQHERKPRVEALVDALMEYGSKRVDDLEGSCGAMVIVNLILILLCSLAVLSLYPLFIAEIVFHGIRNIKEEHAWSTQIVEELLQCASIEDMFAKSYEEKSEAGLKIVDTPLMIAAKNGVVEMVEKIIERFPLKVIVVNEEGKNIALLAAEKRQTKLYQILYQHEKVDKSVFDQVDEDGNTALHLAAKHGMNLKWQTTTMVEEFKWFEFVKRSVPSHLWEIYNNNGKTAEEIFKDSYKEHMTSDRQWLNQTSQTCSVASTLVASMAFSNFAGENINKKNNSSLVALSLSLTSTISFLAILAFRSQSRNFWKYVPFMLQLAILTMFGSIVALWISLMLHGYSLTTYAILGSPIAILTIVSLPIFIGPALMSMFTKVPPPNRNTTSAIHYRRPQRKENGTDSDRNQEPTPNLTSEANSSL